MGKAASRARLKPDVPVIGCSFREYISTPEL